MVAYRTPPRACWPFGMERLEQLSIFDIQSTQIYTLVTVHALREVWAGTHPRAH